MSTVIFAASIITFISICFMAFACLFATRKDTASIPVSRTVELIPPDDNTVPFSYNIPVDSHMCYKNDVVIVVEHPDDKIVMGMPTR